MNTLRQQLFPSASRVSGGALISDTLWIAYRWMALALGVTGMVAIGVASSETAIRLVLENRIVFYGLMFAQLGLVVAFSAVAARASTAVVALMFFTYAAITGITFSTLFMVYTAASIGATFLVSAGAFAGLSAFGLVTKRDLSTLGRFAVFALIGVLIASVVNLFLHSGGLSWFVTVAGVLVFGALTAYDTQRLKTLFAQGDATGNLALVGALTLYLDFINMFLFLLRILGGRRSE
jgi:uncharacterized protein